MALIKNRNFWVRKQMILSLIVILWFSLYKSLEWWDTHGIALFSLHILTAVTISIIADTIFHYYKKKQLYFSQTALITGLIISIVIEPETAFRYTALISFIAIVSKNFIQFKNRHIFNPAAFWIVVISFFIPSLTQSWWWDSNLWLSLVLWLLLLYRLWRFHIIVSYLLTFLWLTAILWAYNWDYSSIFSNFSATLVLFFLFFMLIEPQTSPSTKNKKYIFWIISALFGFIFLNYIWYSVITQSWLLLWFLIANIYTRFYNKKWLYIITWWILFLWVVYQNSIEENIEIVEEELINIETNIDIKVHELEIIAKKFEFIPPVITVKKWEKVILHIKSIDVTHWFSIPEYDLNVSLRKNKTKTVEFIADKVWEFTFSCSVMCGHWHGIMKGKLVVED